MESYNNKSTASQSHKLIKPYCFFSQLFSQNILQITAGVTARAESIFYKSMKKIFFLFFTFHFSLLPLIAQPVTQELARRYSLQSSYTQFQLSIGGTGTDVAHSIIQTTDGGYAVAGYTWSFGGGSNAYIVKIDASGMLQWTRTFRSTGLGDDISSIFQTIDGGYIAAGSSIFKLDKNGTLQWCENISGWGNSIIQTSDGGYAVAGNTYSFGAGQSDMFIVKLNSSGTFQWARTVGGTNNDYGYSIIQTSDGRFVVTGSAWSFGPPHNDILIVQFNSIGILQWAKIMSGDSPNSLIQTMDGGYALAGAILFNAKHVFYIIKLDGSATLQWGTRVELRDANIASSIIQTDDGGYAVAGYTQHVEGYPDWYIVKLDPAGILEWSRVLTGGTEAGNKAFSIIQTMDGGYVVGGFKDSFEPAGDMYIVKYDSIWNTCGSNDSFVTSSSGTGGTITTVTPTVTSPTGFITPRSPVVGSGGTATTLCVTGIKPISNEIPVSFKLFQNYPNPFNSNSKIKYQISKTGDVKLEIFDVLGHEITTLVNETLKPGIYEAEWDGENYPSGVYFYRLEAGSFIETKKMVLLK